MIYILTSELSLKYFDSLISTFPKKGAEVQDSFQRLKTTGSQANQSFSG